MGCLEPGWVADLQVIEINSLPTPAAEHNLYDQLILWRSHSHVKGVMVAGQWRVQNGEVLGADLGAMRARVKANAERMWQKAQ